MCGVLAAQVALHHVLIQPGHGNHGEGAGEELLEEVLLAVHIVEEEDARHVTVGNGAYHTGK